MKLIRTLIIFFTLMMLWQAIVDEWQIPIYLLPSPQLVLMTLYHQSNVIGMHALSTFLETITGFLLGILFGIFAAIVMVFLRPLALWFLPILIMSQAIPTFAIAPLLVIWLGYGYTSKIVTALLMIFFPVTSTFYDGLRQVNKEWLDLAKTMNASRWRTFWFICFPAALPHLAAGIRIAAVIAPIGAIVGEWVGSSSGLGYLMLNANARLQIDMMFAALMVIIALALLLYFTTDKLLRIFVWW